MKNISTLKNRPSPEIFAKLQSVIDFDITKWDVATIGDLFSIQQGKSVSTKNRAGPFQRPFLRTSNIFWGYIDLTTLDKMNFSDEEADRLRLKQGDLLVCEGGEVGRASVWNAEIEDCFYQNHIHRLRKKGDIAHPEFYMYWLQSAILHLGIYTGQSNRTTIPNLSQSRLSSFAVPFPAIDQQRAIAQALQTVQEAIKARQSEVALERERKAALMQYLFTHGTRGELCKQTEIGEIPESWQVVRLGEVCTFTTGKLNSERAVIDGQYSFFTCSQETLKINSHSFDQEAVLLSGNNAQGIYSVKYYKGKFDAYQRTYVITIRNANKLDYRYLLYDLSLKLGWLRRQSIGATTKYLTASIIRSLALTQPTLAEQKQIAAVLVACDDKIAALEQEMGLLEELLRAMLEELMTGRLSAISLIDSKANP